MLVQKAAKLLRGMDPALRTHILLVRHGETDWNKAARLQGQLNPGLNAQGLLQAQQVISSLACTRLSVATQHTLLHC
jgi:bisphosphoglycerate-dependent phosphoglycerate mutase